MQFRSNMALVTVASFDLIGSYFAPERAFFPPILTSLGVTNDVVQLMVNYNGLVKRLKSRMWSVFWVLLVLGVILPIALMFFLASGGSSVIFAAPVGISFTLFILIIGCISSNFHTNTQGLLSEFCTKRK